MYLTVTCGYDIDPMHGYLALVVPVLRDEARYALKVSWLDNETVNEAAALALWDGAGCGA
jgi:streptomycin 6-kinase